MLQFWDLGLTQFWSVLGYFDQAGCFPFPPKEEVCSGLNTRGRGVGSGAKNEHRKNQPTLIQGISSERAFPSENFDAWYIKIEPKMTKLEQFENFGLLAL